MGQLPYKCHKNRVASVGDGLKICPWVTSRVVNHCPPLQMPPTPGRSVRQLVPRGAPHVRAEHAGNAHFPQCSSLKVSSSHFPQYIAFTVSHFPQYIALNVSGVVLGKWAEHLTFEKSMQVLLIFSSYPPWSRGEGKYLVNFQGMLPDSGRDFHCWEVPFALMLSPGWWQEGATASSPPATLETT